MMNIQKDPFRHQSVSKRHNLTLRKLMISLTKPLGSNDAHVYLIFQVWDPAWCAKQGSIRRSEMFAFWNINASFSLTKSVIIDSAPNRWLMSSFLSFIYSKKFPQGLGKWFICMYVCLCKSLTTEINLFLSLLYFFYFILLRI